MLRHRCRMSSVFATGHVPPFHLSEVGNQLPILATIKGHRVVPDAFGPEKRCRQVER